LLIFGGLGLPASTGSPFLEEAAFECAIEKASGWKTMSRNQGRALFDNALSFSNSVNRQMDFIIFSDLALSVRLFGKVNRNEDNVASVNEFNLALDNSILPERFNQKTIEYLLDVEIDISFKNKLFGGIKIKTSHREIQKNCIVKDSIRLRIANDLTNWVSASMYDFTIHDPQNSGSMKI
jgi:hypothetical protein